MEVFWQKRKNSKAAAVIKLAGGAEFLTSILAYLLLLLIAPFAAKFILKDDTTSTWIMIYGIALLANFLTETSTAVLQLANKFKTIAILNLLQNSLTAAWIVFLILYQWQYLSSIDGLSGRKIYFRIWSFYYRFCPAFKSFGEKMVAYVDRNY